jgi:hypothetical protein
VAYEDEEFKKGEFYAAVAPIYTGDEFILKPPMPED